MPGAVAATGAGRARLFGLIAVQCALFLALDALCGAAAFSIDWSDMSHWLAHTGPEHAMGAVGLAMARVLAGWLALSTVAYVAAMRRESPVARRAWRRLTAAPLRRIVVLSVALAATLGPRGPAAAATPVRTLSHAESAPVGDGPVVPPHLRRGEPLDDGSRLRLVRVQPGDHLWGLSSERLRLLAGDGDPGPHEVARYWVRVVEANRGRVRSGNPDLIFPGEVIVLPPVEDREFLW